MGSSDPAERDLYQGLIKLAAAFVHDVRGNPLGVAKNLRGARERLADALAPGRDSGLDMPALVAAIDAHPALASGGDPADRSWRGVAGDRDPAPRRAAMRAAVRPPDGGSASGTTSC